MRKSIVYKISQFIQILLIVFMANLFAVNNAEAVIEIDITSGNIKPIPIGTPEFEAQSKLEKKYAKLILQIINNDMESSGLFVIVNKSSYLDNSSFTSTPKFRDWRLIKVDALVKGKVSLTGSRMTTQFVLWDIASKKNVISIQYTSKAANWRKIAHIIADAIYERLTSEKGYFDTKIVFVDETGPKNKRVKRLAIMDQDGNNIVYLTDGKSLVLTPRFSPKKDEITYVSYKGGLPRVYMYNLKNGRQEIVGDFPNMTFSPRFTPDGNRIVMSLENNGNSNIYVRDLRSGRTERLTNTPAIDIAPSFSPDGKYITFESDRGGTQQIYVMSSNGKDQRRISFGKGRYSTPVWSPRGDYISFTKLLNGIFLIGIIRPDGSGERILTRGYHNEGPTWAPNGRVLAFFRETRGVRGGSKIFTIDITGQNERILPTPNFSSDPSWSPLSK